MEAVTVGAMYVAMLQLLPIAHVAAGLIALLTWEQVANGSPFQPPAWRAELGGFTVTILTALPLLFIAWFFGRGPRLLFAPSVARTPDEVDYVDPQPAGGPEPRRDP